MLFQLQFITVYRVSKGFGVLFILCLIVHFVHIVSLQGFTAHSNAFTWLLAAHYNVIAAQKVLAFTPSLSAFANRCCNCYNMCYNVVTASEIPLESFLSILVYRNTINCKTLLKTQIRPIQRLYRLCGLLRPFTAFVSPLWIVTTSYSLCIAFALQLLTILYII